MDAVSSDEDSYLDPSVIGVSCSDAAGSGILAEVVEALVGRLTRATRHFIIRFRLEYTP